MTKTTAFTADDFIAKFAKTTALSPVYTLYGEETFLRDQILTQFRKRVLQKGSADFDYSVFYGDESGIADILDQLEMLPMLSDRRLVILKGVDDLLASEQKALLTYLANPSKETVFVMTAEKIDKRSTLGKELQAHTITVECKRPRYTNEVTSWLKTEISRSGMRVSPQALNAFVETVPLDYRVVATEWDKLLLYIGKTDSITLKDVQESLSQIRPVTIYELQNALGARSVKVALDLLGRFLSQGESMIFVIAMLSMFFQTIWRVRFLLSRNVPEREITTKYLQDVYPSFRNEYLKYARNYSQKDLDAAFTALYETDSDLKSIDVSELVLGTILIQRICGTKA